MSEETFMWILSGLLLGPVLGAIAGIWYHYITQKNERLALESKIDSLRNAIMLNKSMFPGEHNSGRDSLCWYLKQTEYDYIAKYGRSYKPQDKDNG